MEIFVETERLVLRRFTLDDLDLLVELDSDPEVTHYIDNGAPVDRAELERHLEYWLGYYERPEQYGFWAAIAKSSGEFIGWFHLRPDDGVDLLEPELGYRLRRSAWGRGYASEGSKALVDKAFAELGVNRVNAFAMAVHTASRRVMERAGLRYVRTFTTTWPVRIPGDQAGDVEYALTREQWERDRAAGQPA